MSPNQPEKIEVDVVYQYHAYHACYVASEKHWDLGCPVGYGKTEELALQDLRDMLEERRPTRVFELEVVSREDANTRCPSGW